MQAYGAGSVGPTYSAPTMYTGGSIGTMTISPTATIVNNVPSSVMGSNSSFRQAPVQMPVYTGVPQAARPMTTTPMGYAGGYQQVNQAQMDYNLQTQSINSAIQLETQIQKQVDALKPSKEAMEKRPKMRLLEDKKFELAKCEAELMGVEVDPQVQKSHDRQKFVIDLAGQQEKALDLQHDLEEQKLKQLKAELAVVKFDAGQIDADGKEIKGPDMTLAPWLEDPDVQELIQEKKKAKAEEKSKK